MKTLPRLMMGMTALLLASGCLQLETRIKLHEDGSATVTERLEILPALLEMEAGATSLTGMTFERLLSRERAQERVKEMGKGVTLVSHDVRTTQPFDTGMGHAHAIELTTGGYGVAVDPRSEGASTGT